MLGTDKYAYRSKIKNIEPTDKLFIMLAVLLLCIFLDHIAVSMAAFVGMILLNMVFGKNSFADIKHLLLVPMGFILVASLTILIGRMSSEDALVGFARGSSYIGIGKAGLLQGFSLIAKSLGIMASVYFFVMNTSISDFALAMEKLHVPRLITELMELIYRFIFVLLERTNKIITAQNSRLGYKNLRTSYQSTGILGARIFLDAMRRSDKIYNALESRGYQGQIVTLSQKYERNNTLLASGAAVAMVQIIIFVILRRLG